MLAPPSSFAQAKPVMPLVGYLSGSSPTSDSLDGFKHGLKETGFVDGENVTIIQYWAEGQYDRLPALMKDVVSRDIDVLVTWGTPAAFAAQNATSTIPIVGAVMADPVRSGLVSSFARPGGNLT